MVFHKRRCQQSGFTLIELMVVVVIMSVVVSVGVISMGGNDQTTLRAQAGSAKAFLNFVRDTSAIKQQMYLVVPDKKGLTAYVLKTGRWQPDTGVKKQMWQAGLNMDWQIENNAFVQPQNASDQGWLFWPSGDVMGGAIFMSTQQNQPVSMLQTPSTYSFKWNGLLQFSSLDQGDF